MTFFLPPDFQPCPDDLIAYQEGWKLGRSGSLRIIPKYQDQPVRQDAYHQGWFDAHAGRDCSITQNRSYPEDP